MRWKMWKSFVLKTDASAQTDFDYVDVLAMCYQNNIASVPVDELVYLVGWRK
jgi:hypothetical protein